MRDVSPIHRGGRNYPGSKPLDREGVKEVNLVIVEMLCDETEKTASTRLEKLLNTVLVNASQGVAGERS